MVSLFLVLASPWLVVLITDHLALAREPWLARVLIALLIIATSVVHSFVDFIPATFLGAPDEDTALSVLPAHRLLLKGEGYRAVSLSVRSSFTAVILSFLLLAPFALIIPEPVNAYAAIKTNIFWLLLGVVFLLLITEGSHLPFRAGVGKKGLALLCFLLSGVLGLLTLDMKVAGLLGKEGTTLFPVLTGLFGVPTLLLSLKTSPVLPEQRLESEPGGLLPDRAFLKNSLKGTLAGSVVSFLPGVSSSHAAVLSTLGSKQEPEQEQDSSRADEDFIVQLSSINTSGAFFCLAALFLTLRPRSGATVAIAALISVEDWGGRGQSELYLLLMGVLVGAVFGLLAALWLGKFIARRVHKINYQRVVKLVLGFIIVLVLLFTGPLGFFILGVSAAMGLLAPAFEVRRSQLMGVLLLPVLVFFWPW